MLLLDGAAAAAAQTTAVGAKAEELVLHLLVQLIVILAATRVVTVLARRFLGQTDVAGEILAGLLLGPSACGALAEWLKPGLVHEVFHPSTAPIFVGLAQIGLVLLMFQIGAEFEFKKHIGGDRRAIIAISAAGLALPFALGYATAGWFHAWLGEPRPDLFGFRLFFAVAMSITAIPILGRIFMELGLSHTRTAALTIGAAAVDDVTGWLLLCVVSLLVQGQFSAGAFGGRLAGLAVYLVFVFVVVRPVLRRAVHAHLQRHGHLRPVAISLLLLVLFVSAVITSTLGVFAIIGGFVLGVALHEDREFLAAWKRQVGPLVQTLLLPVFFAYTGLKTDIGSLGGWDGVGVCLAVLAVAVVGKYGGAYVAARWIGETSRSAHTIGICMNTRALMELIVLNIGHDLGVLPKSMFTMLVIMALVTTYMATPLIRRLMRDEVRPPEPELPPVDARAAAAPAA